MSYPSHFGNNFYPQSANEDFLNNLQLANDPLSSGVPSNTINFCSNNINDLTSTQYLSQSEINVLQNETNKTQQPCIIDFYISNASPNINQSTILGIDNMKSLSQSMMSNRINQDNNITQSKINFSSTGDFLKANSMKTVSKDIIDKIKYQYVNPNSDLKERVLEKIQVVPTLQTAIGPISSLEHLIEISTGVNDSTLHSTIYKKYEMYKDVFYMWRKVKGDGNCFYRAVIFRYLEIIVLNCDLQKMEQMIYYFDKCCKSIELECRKTITNTITIKPELNMQLLIIIYELMKSNDIKNAYKMLLKCFISCNSFDYGMIFYYRYLLEMYIKKNENKLYLKDFTIKIGNLLPIEYETNEGNFLFNQFYENYLLKMFKDAEKIIIYLTPFVLKMKLEVVLFDDINESTDCLKELTYGEAAPVNEDSLMVVNRKDHYDLVYTKKAYEKRINILCDYCYQPPYEPVLLKKDLLQQSIKDFGSIEEFLKNIDGSNNGTPIKLSLNKDNNSSNKNNSVFDINNLNQSIDIAKNHIIPSSKPIEEHNIKSKSVYPEWNPSNNNPQPKAEIKQPEKPLITKHSLNEFLNTAIIKKEADIIRCTKCNGECSLNPKNLYFTLCYNCLLIELQNNFLINYLTFFTPHKKVLNFNKFTEIAQTIENSVIIIQGQEVSLGYVILILNSDPKKQNDITIFTLFNALKSKLCKYCDNEVNPMKGVITLPCGCSICSVKCLEDYFYSFLNMNSFYCICNVFYGPYQLMKLYSLLDTYNLGKSAKATISARYKYLVNDHCACCNQMLQEYNSAKVKYEVASDIEKFSDVYKVFKKMKPNHNLCIDCYNKAKEKGGNFFCNFCNAEHFNMQRTTTNDECIII